MRKIAEGAGVTRIAGEVTDVALDPDNGHVRSLTLKSGEVVAGDMFVDCSGFRSLLLGQKLGVAWRDWSHWLPMDRAWAMPCQHPPSSSEAVGHIKPSSSEAVGAHKALKQRSGRAHKALKQRPQTLHHVVGDRSRAGCGQIPLQHRIGNGHVFCSSFIEEDRAADILLKAVPGEKLADPRLIRFRTGRYGKTWEKNVVAIGLSGGFIEPLESTSIYFIQSAITKLLSHFSRQELHTGQ